ncbi:LOW QUALITY PROTEIN: heme oxygenase 1a [Polyodon spathula]|uniref:LOW QUALITY PROTEIN: heme oxygenase 1a n=1 Tax=Polyodon spathula TaxID=7913 RepID=UPI001B7F5DB2|nr:LOW QUALITY PROTEIN: heme oxygenase 1a [Polyodon spathula]
MENQKTVTSPTPNGINSIDSMPRDLSELIKLSTQEVHERAENTEFMKGFHSVTLTQLKLLLSSLYTHYSALEEELDRLSSNPCLSPLCISRWQLHRVAALQADLRYHYGADWRNEAVLAVPAATREYAERIHEVAHSNPCLLISHSYTRYLGDLSGGQVLRRLAQRSLALPPTGEGLSFFCFPEVSHAGRFKELYRARMNSLELSDLARGQVLQEAQTAFLLNVKVFEAIQKMSVVPPPRSSENGALRNRVPPPRTHSIQSEKGPPTSSLSASPALRLVLALCFAVVTVAVGIYAL